MKSASFRSGRRPRSSARSRRASCAASGKTPRGGSTCASCRPPTVTSVARPRPDVPRRSAVSPRRHSDCRSAAQGTQRRYRAADRALLARRRGACRQPRGAQHRHGRSARASQLAGQRARAAKRSGCAGRPESAARRRAACGAAAEHGRPDACRSAQAD